VRQRVLAYVTRERHGRTELLVFEHRDDPQAGTQVPAGRLEAGETLHEGLLRELHEEAGIEDADVVRELQILGDRESEYEEHAFELHLRRDHPDSWDHVVQGDGDDAGMVFTYRWLPVDSDIELWGGDPTYTQLR
jgi:8-oxo-dGTP pyrophosphatase MutT (NUDIX family)